ncbi:MAG: hypothetical protein N2738_09030, partial [Thermodesulfovibrionales bacterium]|nr:hypothetical protein [Thermodesulfovibrionales bacterium]
MFIKREIGYLCRGEHGEPHKVLGIHTIENKTVIRAFMPEADKAWIIKESPDGDKWFEMEKVYRIGFFIYTESATERFKYRIKIITHWGQEREFYDPYAFDIDFITDFDHHLIGEGVHYRLYEKMGSHLHEIDG